MRNQSAALAAALFTVFSAVSTGAYAQQSPRLPGAPGQSVPGPRIQPGQQPQMVPSPLILPPGTALMVNPNAQPVILEERAVVLPRGPIVLSETGILILPQGGQLLLSPDKPPVELPAGIAIITLPKPENAPAPSAPGAESAPAGPDDENSAAPESSAPPAPPQERASPANAACGPAMTVHQGLAQSGETPVSVGVVRDKEGDAKALFLLYGDRESASWTIVLGKLTRNEACIKLSGDDLSILPAIERFQGILIADKPQARKSDSLEKLEDMLKKGGLKLQLTGDSSDGQIRVYANTDSHEFALAIVKPDGKADIVALGDGFKGPEDLDKIEQDRKAKALVQPAPALPAPPAVPSAVPAPAP